MVFSRQNFFHYIASWLYIGCVAEFVNNVNAIKFHNKGILPTAGINFTNILRAAFRCADPKSTKKTVKLSSFFALLGSAPAKAAHRMWVKLTPRCQFYPHFTSSIFVQKSFEQLFSTYISGLYLFAARKLAQKLLVNCC